MKNHFVAHFQELKKLGKEYIDLHLSLAKMESMDRLTKIIVFLLLLFIAISFFSIIVILLGIVFALWFSSVAGTLSQGILLYVGILILLVTIFYIFRESLFINPILRKFNMIFFDENNIKNQDHEEQDA